MKIEIKIINRDKIDPAIANIIDAINNKSAPQNFTTNIDITTEFTISMNGREFNLTIVHYAAMMSLEHLSHFVENFGVSIDHYTRGKDTLSHYAALTDNTETTQYLLDEGADTNLGNKAGEKPVHYAAISKDNQVIKILLKSSINLSEGNNLGETPLHFAARYGNKSAIEAFKNAGIQVDQGTATGLTALHIAAQYDQTEIIEVLVKQLGAKVDCGTTLGFTPLHMAAAKGNEKSLTKLLEHHAAKDQGTGSADKDTESFTAAHFAAYCDHPRIIQILKQNNANLEQGSKKGYTPLHIAAIFANEKVLAALLEQKTNINAGDTNWDTAIFFAAGKGKIDFSKVENSYKAFGFAAKPIPSEEAYKIVARKLLLSSSEKVTLQYNDHNHAESAISYATKVGFTQIKKLLTDYQLCCRPDDKPQQVEILTIFEASESIEFFREFVQLKCTQFNAKQLNEYCAKLRLNAFNIADEGQSKQAVEFNKLVAELKKSCNSVIPKNNIVSVAFLEIDNPVSENNNQSNELTYHSPEQFDELNVIGETS